MLIRGLILLTVFASGAWCAATYKDNQYQKQLIALQQKEEKAERYKQNIVQLASDRYNEGVQVANTQNAKLFADLHNDNLRLSANVTRYRKAANGARVRYEEERAELSKKDSEFLLNISKEADDVVRQLTACQAIVAADRKG